MRSSVLLALVASISTASAQTYRGFNYGSTFTDGSPKVQSDYQNDFSTAQNLVGTSGFTSARLYTMIQPNTANSPIEAIPAAIATKTSLLLGMWASAGEANINNEILAFQNAVNTYGSAFVDLIVAISVGSEDLYRISPTGIINKSGIGAEPTDIVNYINQVRQAIAGTAASSKPIGHVDTWTAWVNGSNNAVINACDFIGMDAYPYFQTTLANSIENGNSTFFDAYDATLAAVGGKPVWVTETGWPVSGPTENLAVPSTQNAQTYWDQVGCSLFGKVSTWWYTLQDAAPTTPAPSFGIVGSSLTTTPLYNLQCPAISAASSSSAVTASSTASVESATSSSITSGTASVVVGGGAGSTQTPVPGPLPAPSISSVTSAPVGPQASSSQDTASSVAPSSASSASDTAVPSSGTAPASSAATPVQGSSTFATITKTSIAPSASPSSPGCPVDLSGQFEYPHLIVPIDKSQPDTAKGTSYNGTFSSTVSSIYNFDFPASDAGKTCSLVFLLPTQSQLVTSSFTLTGTGGMTVSRLQSPATQQTTYNTCPAVAQDIVLPRTIDSVTPGNEYVIASGPCYAGQRIAWEISATESLSLDYFQNYGPAPIGLYITVC